MWDDTIDKPIAFGGCDIDGITQQQQFEGTSASHHTRQQIACPHIGPGQSDFREEEGKTRSLRGDAQVRCKREYGSRSRGHAVEGRDDRLIQLPHVMDDGSGHARKFQVAFHVALQYLADDCMHITTGAKIISRAGQHHGPHAIVVTQRLKQVTKLGIYLKSERVHHFGTVQGQGCYAVVYFIEKIIGHATPLSPISVPDTFSMRASSADPWRATTVACGCIQHVISTLPPLLSALTITTRSPRQGAWLL